MTHANSGITCLLAKRQRGHFSTDSRIGCTGTALRAVTSENIVPAPQRVNLSQADRFACREDTDVRVNQAVRLVLASMELPMEVAQAVGLHYHANHSHFHSYYRSAVHALKEANIGFVNAMR